MKKMSIIVLLPLFFACNNVVQETKPTAAATDSVKTIMSADTSYLIIPGKSIGMLSIGLPADTAIAWLGRPDSSDAAMGSALMAWYSKGAVKHRMAIFCRRNMGNDETSRIKRIMVTSPRFKTREGIAAGTALTDLQKYFHLTLVQDETAAAQGLAVYDDTARGIAFDVDRSTKKCSAIAVHQPGTGGTTYINMH